MCVTPTRVCEHPRAYRATALCPGEGGPGEGGGVHPEEAAPGVHAVLLRPQRPAVPQEGGHAGAHAGLHPSTGRPPPPRTTPSLGLHPERRAGFGVAHDGEQRPPFTGAL